MCVQWKDGSTSWEKRSVVKECYPVQTAEYAVSNDVDSKPAFNWWVNHVLNKRDRIISKMKLCQKQFVKTTEKYGINVPCNVEHAYELDQRNGDKLLADAIAKEMKNVRIAFDILPNGERVPNNHQRIHCHMMFDIKIESFCRKVRLVAGGNASEAPKCMTYSSVVSRESVRIALTLASLNELEVKAGDVENAYITAPITGAE